ncbi:MAG TPA: hypothetical protein VMT88_13485 [Actinomycetes bacterium]|nr:hypothetical protein [Actinomycetes bacterium]
MRRRGWLIGGVSAATVACVGLLAGPSIAERLMHPPDVDGFQAYVNQYAGVGSWSSSNDPGGPERDTAWVKTHPDEVLAEGNAACAWLGEQPDAPDVDPSGNTAFDTVLGKYLDDVQDFAPQELSSHARATVVVGAWAYLCHSDRASATSPRSRESD